MRYNPKLWRSLYANRDLSTLTPACLAFVRTISCACASPLWTAPDPRPERGLPHQKASDIMTAAAKPTAGLRCRMGLRPAKKTPRNKQPLLNLSAVHLSFAICGDLDIADEEDIYGSERRVD